MDVERTIQFILDCQAKAEIRAEDGERKLDRRFDAITKIIQQGMKTLAGTQTQVAGLVKSQKELAQTHKELAQAHKELAQAHTETERTLKAFIASSRYNKNGQNGR